MYSKNSNSISSNRTIEQSNSAMDANNISIYVYATFQHWASLWHSRLCPNMASFGRKKASILKDFGAYDIWKAGYHSLAKEAKVHIGRGGGGPD